MKSRLCPLIVGMSCFKGNGNAKKIEESRNQKKVGKSINAASEEPQNQQIIINVSDAANASEESLDHVSLEDDDEALITPINNSDSVDEVAYGLWDVFKSLSSLSVPMALSFTFSF